MTVDAQRARVSVRPLADRVFFDSGVTSQWRNDGPSTAVVLAAGLTSFAMYNFPSGISYDGLAVGMTLNATPTAPTELTLRQMVLAPEARLSIHQQAGLEALGVESGSVHVAFSNIANPLGQIAPVDVCRKVARPERAGL